MSGWRRVVLFVLAGAAAGGCAIARKPYADDPLIRSLNAVWGDREKARAIPEQGEPQPDAPDAPAGDLVGVSSRLTGR
ncbi:MAG: hypothetical protein U0791_21740 [Gemmataceae bacterium]